MSADRRRSGWIEVLVMAGVVVSSAHIHPLLGLVASSLIPGLVVRRWVPKRAAAPDRPWSVEGPDQQRGIEALAIVRERWWTVSVGWVVALLLSMAVLSSSRTGGDGDVVVAALLLAAGVSVVVLLVVIAVDTVQRQRFLIFPDGVSVWWGGLIQWWPFAEVIAVRARFGLWGGAPRWLELRDAAGRTLRVRPSASAPDGWWRHVTDGVARRFVADMQPRLAGGDRLELPDSFRRRWLSVGFVAVVAGVSGTALRTIDAPSWVPLRRDALLAADAVWQVGIPVTALIAALLAAPSAGAGLVCDASGIRFLEGRSPQLAWSDITAVSVSGGWLRLRSAHDERRVRTAVDNALLLPALAAIMARPSVTAHRGTGFDTAGSSEPARPV